MSSPNVRVSGSASLGGSRSAAGIGIVLLSSVAFATSGPFAKSLLLAGWTPAGVVTWRVVIAAAVLAPWVAYSMRGQWSLLRRNLSSVLAFGLVAVAGCQFAYFNAVASLSVGVALLLEYLGIVLVVVWVWAVHGRVPSRLTVVGAAISIVGLLFVLDVFSGAELSVVGVIWGLLAAVGLATYYVSSAEQRVDALPPVALAGLGLAVGAIALCALSFFGILDYATNTTPVILAGAELPWWFALGGLAVIATATAYGLGVVGTRAVGSTIASFVGLSEVVATVLFAWLLLGELPAWIQLIGGVLILGGVVAVRLGERPGPLTPMMTSAQERDFVSAPAVD